MTTIKHFYSPDCTVCQEMKPELNKFEKSHKDLKIQKINIETTAGSREAELIGVSGVPYTMIVDSKCQKNVIGLATKKELDYALNKSCAELHKKPIHKA